MSIRLNVLEYSTPKIRDNIILGVKIIGTESANGYSYPLPVLRQAVPLYEGAPVFIEHPNGSEKKRNSRHLADHFGVLQNIRQGEGLFGDLHIKQSHPMAKAVLEEAAGAARFGLSHNAIVDMADDAVTEIVSVNSVDLVDKPATTKNLFESEDMDTERLTALEAKVDTLLERLPDKPKKETPKRITALENVEEPEAEKIGNSHDDFLATLRGFALK
jgi:hypothetical protein